MKNSFRILANTFQLLQSMMQQESGVVMCVVTASVILQLTEVDFREEVLSTREHGFER